MIFCTDGIHTIKIPETSPIPDGFRRGRTFNSNPWNKGLTKDTDDRVKLNGQKTRNTRKQKGYISWNTGLTKETNSSLQRVSELVSESRKGKSSWNKGISMKDESKQKLSERNKGKIAWNKGLSKDSDERVESISKTLSGHKCFVSDWKTAKQKEYETRRKHNTFNCSKLEQQLYEYYVTMYGNENVIRQYRCDRYPFNCDLYIVPEDLFIEYHGTWSHGGHPYDCNSDEDKLKLSEWEMKSKTSIYYKSNIYTWTDLDVRKLSIMRNNHLNFQIIYPNNLIITE